MIETARLQLRPWSSDDLEDAVRLWGDADVMALLGGPLDRLRVEERLAREMEWQREYGYQYWRIADRNSGEFVGCCGLKPSDWEDSDVVETGFHLLRDRWGGGYASEAATGAVRYAFEALQLDRVYAGHHPGNEASRRVLQKLGFECIGNRFYAPTGLIHPWYELPRSTFARVLP